MKNSQKGFVVPILITTAILTLIGISGWTYVKSQKIEPENRISISQEKLIETGRSKETEKKILSIIDHSKVSVGEIKIGDYSISETKKYALVALSLWESKEFYLIDLENNKVIIPKIKIMIEGNFSESNHRWLDSDSKLVIASSWGAFGADGFPGILQINTSTGDSSRVIDKTDECKTYNPMYLCLETYKFTIENDVNNKITYKVLSKPENIPKELVKSDPKTQAPVICAVGRQRCPDGAYVEKTSPNCEFDCSKHNGQPVTTLKKLEEKYKFSFDYPSEYIETYDSNTNSILFISSKPSYKEPGSSQTIIPPSFDVSLVFTEEIQYKDLGGGLLVYDRAMGKCKREMSYSNLNTPAEYQDYKVNGFNYCKYSNGDAGMYSESYIIIEPEGNYAIRISTGSEYDVDSIQKKAPIENFISTFKFNN